MKKIALLFSLILAAQLALGVDFQLNRAIALDKNNAGVSLSANKNADGSYSLNTIGTGTSFITLNMGVAQDNNGARVRLSGTTNADGTFSIATSGGGGGAGTVTSIGVTTANGISGTSSGGATPSLTLTLGAITPTTVNGGTIRSNAFTATPTGTGVYHVTSGALDAASKADGADGGTAGGVGDTLQIKRGTTAQRTSVTPANGELIWDTDISSMFVGNGSTAGGIIQGPMRPVILKTAAPLTVLTAGTPADIGTITVPAWITRYKLAGSSSTSGMAAVCVAETAAGTLVGASVGLYDGAGATGNLLTLTSVNLPTAAGNISSWSYSLANGVAITSSTIYIRQTANSANAGTVSFYVTIYPLL